MLRYAPFFSALKEIIDSGEIGDIVSVVHNENVGNIHQSHSFVRGNWSNSKESAPMILAKSCHDMDILQWLIGKKCLKINSFGSRKFFNRANCPEGAPARCTDGCKHDCPYDARKVYAEDAWYGKGWFRPVVANCANPTDEEVTAALKTGPYGRCVFRCDNDVVDHQTVNMEFEDGVTVMFSMCGLTPDTSRTIKIMGTKGQIMGHMEKKDILVTNFLTREERKAEVKLAIEGGHGGGDAGIINAFSEYVSGAYTGNAISEITVSAENHMLAFAAEESRTDGGRTIEL